MVLPHIINKEVEVDDTLDSLGATPMTFNTEGGGFAYDKANFTTTEEITILPQGSITISTNIDNYNEGEFATIIVPSEFSQDNNLAISKGVDALGKITLIIRNLNTMVTLLGYRTIEVYYARKETMPVVQVNEVENTITIPSGTTLAKGVFIQLN